MFLAIALAALTLIMAYLGFHLAITPATSNRAKWAYRIAFIVCGAISLVLIGIQGYKSDQSEKRATEAQRQATELSKEAIATSTGGDSSCYVKFLFQGSQATIIVLQRGKFPLMEVTVRLWDSNDITQPWRRALPIPIGTLPVGGSRNIGKSTMPENVTEAKYVAAFTARNGAWDELILLRRDVGGWHFAAQIQRNPGQVTFENLDSSLHPIYEVIDKGFPGDTGNSWKDFNGQERYCTDCK
jgi:hypothetical protein